MNHNGMLIGKRTLGVLLGLCWLLLAGPAAAIQENPREVVIDTFTLGPGERVVIRDNPDIAVEDGEILYEDNLRFGVNDPGAVVLLDDIDTPLDFIRFNDSTTEPPEGVSWDESAGMLVTSQDESKGLSRENETEDNDRSDDFCVAQGTRGAANADCD